MEKKTCSKCKKEKLVDDFQKDATHSDGRRSDCKECSHASKKLYYNSESNRLIGIRSRHKLSPENLTRLEEKQKHKCAICKRDLPKDGKYRHIDHDHNCCPTNGKSCGKCIRGILCGNCNVALGGFEDNIEFLNNAIQYLYEYSTRNGR